MKHKLLASLGFVLAVLLIGVASVQAAITISGTTLISNGVIAIDGAAASNHAIGTSTTSGTITIGGVAQTGTMTLGSSSAANIVEIGNGSGTTTVNIATGSTSVKYVNIATSSQLANVINIGSVFGTAATTIRGGTSTLNVAGGAINLTGLIYATGTSPAVTTGGGAATVVGSDVVGTITGIATLHSSSTITFGTTRSAAPVCTVSLTSDSFANLLSTSTTWVVPSITNLAIYHASTTAAATWSYICLGK